MARKSIITALALFCALPAFANTTKFQAPPSPAAQDTQPVLRLMSDSEFATFLSRLDSELARSQQSMKKMDDVASLTSDAEERQQLQQSYNRCVQSLESARDEIQKLSQKQTLKLDLFLLIELNQLARNLDSLDENLMGPAAANGARSAQKSLVYARQVLNIDGALAARIAAFQQHFIAFTGVVDATLGEANPDAAEAQPQK